MTLDEMINTIFSFRSSGDMVSEALIELTTGSDIKVSDIQRGVERVLRLNIVSKDKIKAEVLQVLIDRLELKNQQIECSNPKSGMKVKFRTRNDFISFLMDSIYEPIGNEMKLIEKEIDELL